MCISLKTEICEFVHIIIIIYNIISLAYSLCLQLLLKKNSQPCSHVSVIYLKTHTQQIANWPSLENFFTITLEEFCILKKLFKNKITGFFCSVFVGRIFLFFFQREDCSV